MDGRGPYREPGLIEPSAPDGVTVVERRGTLDIEIRPSTARMVVRWGAISASTLLASVALAFTTEVGFMVTFALYPFALFLDSLRVIKQRFHVTLDERGRVIGEGVTYSARSFSVERTARWPPRAWVRAILDEGGSALVTGQIRPDQARYVADLLCAAAAARAAP